MAVHGEPISHRTTAREWLLDSARIEHVNVCTAYRVIHPTLVDSMFVSCLSKLSSVMGGENTREKSRAVAFFTVWPPIGPAARRA